MNIEKVELWLNKCYSCHSKEYQPIMDWFLTLGLPLNKFESVRVPLKTEWQDFAKQMKEKGINLPFVVIYMGNSEIDKAVFTYSKFIEQIEKGKDMNITPAQFADIRRKILVKQKEEKDEAVNVVNMKKKTNRKKSTVLKKGKTTTTAVE